MSAGEKAALAAGGGGGSPPLASAASTRLLRGNGRGGLTVAGGVRITNIKEIQGALELVKGRVRTNVIRRGLYAGGVVLRDEARRLVRVRTGAIKKAIVVKRGDPLKGTASISFGIARIRFVMRSKVAKSGATKRVLSRVKGIGGRGFITPRRYAHLVELGTSHSRPYSFIVRAAVGRGTAAVDAMLQKMGVDLTAEVSKLRV